jgi:hypothetical protein
MERHGSSQNREAGPPCAEEFRMSPFYSPECPRFIPIQHKKCLVTMGDQSSPTVMIPPLMCRST